MKRNPQHELREIVNGTAAKFLTYTEPTAREVGDRVLAEHDEFIRKIGYELAKLQVYEISSRCMKTALLTQDGVSEQLELDIDIKGIPSAISFPCGGDIRYVALARATEKHLLAYVEILKQQIAADSRKLQVVKELHDRLADVFARNPGITVREAAALYRSMLAPA